MGYVLAVLEVESEDDGMTVCKTGCVDGNGKSVFAIINERNCVYIDKKFKSGFLKNWHLFLNSPEYPLYKLISDIKMDGGDNYDEEHCPCSRSFFIVTGF